MCALVATVQGVVVNKGMEAEEEGQGLKGQVCISKNKGVHLWVI